MKARRITPFTYVSYGATDILGAGAVGVTGAWLLYFYTTFCGLTAIEAATIFAVARVVDAIASPLIGFISDNFGGTAIGRRFGRRRSFLLISVFLLPCFALMWVSGQSFWYYLLTYIFFDFVYAAVLIPYETLASEMTSDYKQKAKFAGARLLFGQAASLLAGVLPGRIVDFMGKDDANTFLYLGLIFSGLFMIAVLLTWSQSWERDRTGEPPEAPRRGNPILNLYGDLWSTLKIRTFRIHLGMYLSGYIAMDVFNAVFAYFVVFALGSSMVLASNLLGTVAFGQFFGVMAAISLCLTLQPAPTYRLAIVLCGAGITSLLAIYLVKPSDLNWWLYGAIALAGLGRGGLAYIPWNLYNYMGDIDEVITGKRRDGTIAGVMTFVRKAAQALAVMSVGAVLEWSGFAAKAATQSQATNFVIVCVLIGGTLTLMVTGFAVSTGLSLNNKTHAVLSSVVSRLKAGESEFSESDKQTVERLTGWTFSALWGRGPLNRSTRWTR
ncbi:MFS transporter [Asticcacaulis sp. DXS10W]|uniref:MFS transporter n=1 Tax=Asticcacaulis currens TaxID=2984210 RepID=A0ABT5IBZ7_9CAUL|nr:MFS transporter [Asticcacaulis currens]MDC7693707.1 MFS transporter [Asticcacaulis currens]